MPATQRGGRDGQHILLAIQRYGPGISAWLAFDGTYRWRYAGDHVFNQFWLRMVNLLGHGKALHGARQFWLRSAANHYNVGDRIELAMAPVAAYGDAESGNWVAHVDVDGEPRFRLPWKHGALPHPYSLQFVAPVAGRYDVRTFQVGEEQTAPVGELQIMVAAPVAEAARPADQTLMRQMAEQTGGIAGTWSQRDRVTEWLADRTTRYRFQEERIPLWNHPVMFVPVPLLLILEWWLRKRWRLA